MNTIIVFFLLTLQAASASANANYDRGVFTNGSTVCIAADKVNIRSRPDVKSPLVANLSVGTPVTILNKSGEDEKINNLTAPWYKVRFAEGGKNKTGHVWGGFLSIVTLPVRHGNSPALFIMGIKEADKNNFLKARAMIVKGNSIANEIEFDPIQLPEGDRPYTYSVSGELMGNRGFSGISNVIMLNFTYPACGYPNGSIVLIYDGNRIQYGLESTSMVESGVFHMTSTLIFPDEKGGKKDKITCVRVNESFDEEKKEYIPKQKTVTIHTWDGKKFSESGE